MTWAWFKEVFYEKYFPQTLKDGLREPIKLLRLQINADVFNVALLPKGDGTKSSAREEGQRRQSLAN